MDIKKLFGIIEERKKEGKENSYVSSLNKKGLNRIAQKVGEEAVEVIIAAKNKKKKEVIAEMADLWFHALVLLSFLNINPDEIFDELDKRHKIKKK